MWLLKKSTCRDNHQYSDGENRNIVVSLVVPKSNTFKIIVLDIELVSGGFRSQQLLPNDSIGISNKNTNNWKTVGARKTISLSELDKWICWDSEIFHRNIPFHWTLKVFFPPADLSFEYTYVIVTINCILTLHLERKSTFSIVWWSENFSTIRKNQRKIIQN